MIKIVLKGMMAGRARVASAVVGIAVAVGSLVFMTSLVATNNAQAPAAAKKACAPWTAWRLTGVEAGFRRGRPGGPRPERRRGPGPDEREERNARAPAQRGDMSLSVVATTVDYRPGGHVLQGPPMMALIANAPRKNPYVAVALTAGRWVSDASEALEVVCVKKSMRRFGAHGPALGEMLKFVGRKGTMTAKIVGYLDGDKLPSEFPYVFANAKAFDALAGEKHGTWDAWRPEGMTASKVAGLPGVLTPTSESVIRSFKQDEQKRMDYATPLLLVAAFLTALSLLVNALLLSVEAKRKEFATLRILGMTRSGVVGLVTVEAAMSALAGWALGTLGADVALAGWVALDAPSFPAGMAMDVPRIGLTLAVMPIVVLLAVLFALRPALKVRPMDAAARRPMPRRRGMAITFACGFAAFVAVEVWGASLMRAFVPSPEWPDAIVSILPCGVKEPDWDALENVEGVKRICELCPLQCLFAGGAERRNVLFLGADWLPEFKFLEGDWKSADAAIRASDAVVITEMMSNAHKLHLGDKLTVMVGRGPMAEEVSLPIAGVVDLNWHMVTSRGLVRGMNGAPGMTDGPAFCSYETFDALNRKPPFMTDEPRATHLWVDYEPTFLAKHGVFPAGRLIERGIAKALGDPTDSTVRLHARDEIADGTLAHGSDIIGQAARVPFVFLAILAIGFVAMLVAEADARTHAFKTLRAVGATRAQLAGRLVVCAVKTALVGIVVGVPLGALTGWLFTFKTGNWPGLPHWFVLPADVVAEGAIGALVFALIFAVPTALGLVGKRRAA